MEANEKRIKNIDCILQAVLYIPTAFTLLCGLINSEFFIIGMIGMIFLGGYQVMSGIIGFARNRNWKSWYLLIVVIYFAVWAIAYLIPNLAYVIPRELGIAYIIVLPMIIGAVYLGYCIHDWKIEPARKKLPVEMEDEILDAGVI